MDIKEFLDSIATVVLFPGNLGDLNHLMAQVPLEGKKYEYLAPPKGPRKYLEGLLLPTPGPDMSSYLRALTKIIVMLHEEEGPIEEPYKTLEGMYQKTLSQILTPEVMEIDIRLKAKQLGATGLVHLQYLGQPSLGPSG